MSNQESCKLRAKIFKHQYNTNTTQAITLNAQAGSFCKGYYCGHLGLPSGQPTDTPRMAVVHVPPARARSI